MWARVDITDKRGYRVVFDLADLLRVSCSAMDPDISRITLSNGPEGGTWTQELDMTVDKVLSALDKAEKEVESRRAREAKDLAAEWKTDKEKENKNE